MFLDSSACCFEGVRYRCLAASVSGGGVDGYPLSGVRGLGLGLGLEIRDED